MQRFESKVENVIDSLWLLATTMRAELIGHFEPCMTDIYLHIDARMADYIRTHPYVVDRRRRTGTRAVELGSVVGLGCVYN